MESEDPSRLAARHAAARRMRVDHASAVAVRALDAVGIQCILLKGASITRWLFEPEDARVYVDCDLLVSPSDFRATVETLETQGFERELDEAAMPTWWREHALTTRRPSDGTIIDVHRGLPGAQVSDAELWARLSTTTDTMVIGDVVTTVLSEPARVLHAALHAAQHGGSPRDEEVLARAITRLDPDGWRTAAELASALQATAAFHRGLSFIPAGAELADRLGVDAARETEVELRAAGATEALTLSRVLSTQGLAARASLIGHKLVPPPTFMRKWSPRASQGSAGLVIAYLWRPLWVLSRLPRALRAWVRARRATPRSGTG